MKKKWQTQSLSCIIGTAEGGKGMKVLILSCSTGGGHNSAGHAVEHALEKRGHQVVMMDPYELKSSELAQLVGNVYVKTVQAMPRVFGGVYKIGDMVRRVPGRSPVYAVNAAMAKPLEQYIAEEGFDAVVMPHLFPAEIITYMKRHGMRTPFSVFVATDYTCIPFTEETDCDYYVIPSKDLIPEFSAWGIPQEKLVPLGIPVGEGFGRDCDRKALRKELGLDGDRQYLMISGGSMGAGDLAGLLRAFVHWIGTHASWRALVICGSNQELKAELEREYAGNSDVELIGYTKRMADYVNCCDVFVTKPGGLSATEAAAVGVPLIYISPIPGCENRNLEYFCSRGMSLSVLRAEEVQKAMEQLENPDFCRRMIQAQHADINRNAAEDICRFLEEKVLRTDLEQNTIKGERCHEKDV